MSRQEQEKLRNAGPGKGCEGESPGRSLVPAAQAQAAHSRYSAEQTIFDRMYGIWYFTIETAGSISTQLILSGGYPAKFRNVLSRAVETAK